MEAGAEFSASRSLIDEIRLENERLHAERKTAARRRRRRNTAIGIAVAASLVALGVAIRHTAERRRIEGRLEVAQAALASDSPAELQRAADALASNLAVEPAHDDSLGLLAMVRVHQFAEGWIPQDAAEQAIAQAAEANSPEASLARGMLAGLLGDFDQARRSYEAHAQGSSAAAVRNDTAWLRGVAALGRPYDRDVVTGAATAVKAALADDPEWIPNRRVAIALAHRLGQREEALTLVQEGRKQDPTHLGLATDEVLLHALLGREIAGVRRAADALLENPGFSPVDRAYVHLALAAVDFHEGDPRAAVERLDEAWREFPKWDNHARDLAIDLALSHGEERHVGERLEGAALDPTSKAIYDAWRKLVVGDTRSALELLRAAPQDSPRVAQLQALALVDQHRWEEAEPWLAYAAPTLGGRLDLQVAEALVGLRRGDATQAREALEKLAEVHPRGPRVWTALAHARLDDEDAAAFDEAIEQAVEHEPRPAEAHWLQGQRLGKSTTMDPERLVRALTAYRAAVESNPVEPRYRVALGLQYAVMGYPRQAEEELARATDPETGINDGEALLALAKLLMLAARDERKPVASDVPALLTRAASTSVNPWWVELEWSRYELAQATQQSVASARLRVSGVIEQMPRNVEALVVLGEAMSAQGDYDAARDSFNAGIRRTLRTVDGPLYLGLAQLDLASGNKRSAASQAFKGWRKLYNEPATPADLVRAAPFVAQLWTELENARGARTVMRELTVRVPYHAEAWMLRARAEFADGQDEKGCEAALKAAELEPKNPMAVALEGDCRVKQRDFKLARAAYERAATLAEGTPLARELQKKRRRL